MDISNEEELEFFVNDAYRSFRKEYLSPNSYPPMVLHEYLIENPILHEAFVIGDVYREYMTLTI